MKIAVTTSGKELDSILDPRFGRCPYFLVIDSETMEFESVSNPGASAGGGAGIKASQALIGLDVDTLITGQCGPNAFGVLKGAGVTILQAPAVSARRAVEMYTRGELMPTNGIGKAHQGMRGRDS